MQPARLRLLRIDGRKKGGHRDTEGKGRHEKNAIRESRGVQTGEKRPVTRGRSGAVDVGVVIILLLPLLVSEATRLLVVMRHRRCVGRISPHRLRFFIQRKMVKNQPKQSDERF